jgi:predicted GTPase
MSNENFEAIIDAILTATDKLPGPVKEKIKAEVIKIKEMIVDNRPPRIMIIGRRGAGKSSLINAIFRERVAKVGAVVSETGKAEWHTFQNGKGAVRILDTRGLGDRTKPESANFENSIDEIKDAVKEECPDAILFLCKAKEADAHIAEDLKNVIQIKEFVLKEHGYALPLAAVVTQIDELDPKRVDPPYDDEDKQKNISLAVSAISEALRAAHIDALKVIPVSTYAEYKNGSKVYDNYYNVDVLVDYLMDVLPNSAQLQLARLSTLTAIQRKFARVLIGSTSTICAGIAATPIPVADLIPITTAQLGMISGIAYISGRELSQETAKEFLVAAGANVGAAFVVREGARALIKFVFPGAGNAVSAGIAFAATWGIGEVAIAYFIEGKSMDEAKKRFESAKSDAEKQYGGG